MVNSVTRLIYYDRRNLSVWINSSRPVTVAPVLSVNIYQTIRHFNLSLRWRIIVLNFSFHLVPWQGNPLKCVIIHVTYGNIYAVQVHCSYYIVASELKDPIWHSSEWQIGSFSSEATIYGNGCDLWWEIIIILIDYFIIRRPQYHTIRPQMTHIFHCLLNIQIIRT